MEQAAIKVNISKKSLDDYLFQIRFGHRFKFNFNEHYNEKVGVLRDFVRQSKKNDKTELKSRKNAQKKAIKKDKWFEMKGSNNYKAVIYMNSSEINILNEL